MLRLDFHRKLQFPIDAIDTLKDSRIQKIVSAALFYKVLGQPGEISLFVSCFSFAHTNNLHFVRNILETEHILVI